MAALSTLRTKTRKLIREETAANSHFTDSEIDSNINQAVEFIASELQWPTQISTATTIEGQALYSLPDDFIALVEIYLDNKPLPIYDRSDLVSIAPGWQEAASSTPRLAYRADSRTFGLWPAPDAASASDTIQIQYINIPAALSADADVPDLHSGFQLCIPFYAAFLCELSMGNDKKADVNFKLYDLHKKRLVTKVDKFADADRRFKWG